MTTHLVLLKSSNSTLAWSLQRPCFPPAKNMVAEATTRSQREKNFSRSVSPKTWISTWLKNSKCHTLAVHRKPNV